MDQQFPMLLSKPTYQVYLEATDQLLIERENGELKISLFITGRQTGLNVILPREGETTVITARASLRDG